MTHSEKPRHTAQIIQFRPRESGRARAWIAEPAPPRPLVVGKAWYHEDAIAGDANTNEPKSPD